MVFSGSVIIHNNDFVIETPAPVLLKIYRPEWNPALWPLIILAL